jgi:phosphate butyryltransferase
VDPVQSFADLRERAREIGPVPVAVVAAASDTALRAASAAAEQGIARPLLVGDRSAITERLEALDLVALADAPIRDAPDPRTAARVAVALARSGEAGVLLKGALRTDELLRAVLDRDGGLRTDRLLSDVLLYEDRVSGETRLVGITDGGINPAPDSDTLYQIVANGVEVLRLLGWSRPRVALLSATEVVTHSVASTGLARVIADRAISALPDADVAGPLALDNALLPSAAEAKGITGPVAGRADLLVAPSIEAGNILGKAVKYLGGSITAHVIVGAAVPILIPSRVESAEDKLHSIALGALVRAGTAETIGPMARPGASNTGRAGDRS